MLEARRVGAAVHFEVIASGYGANVSRVFAMPEGERDAVAALAAWMEADGWMRSAMGPDTFERFVVEKP